MLCMAALLILEGCGPKPPKQIPVAGVTTDAALLALMRQAEAVNTLSVTAKVRVKGARNEESAATLIVYRRPAEFKITVFGFAGMELAEAASRGDSIVAYIPFYNSYVSEPEGKNLVRMVAPGIDFDPARLFSALAGPVLPPGEPDEYQITLNTAPESAELVFTREGMAYRYILNGSGLLVTGETVTADSTLVWNITREDFTTENGILFPRRITIRDEHRSLRFDFSTLAINSGLPGDAFTVTIPDDAKRIPVRSR